MSNISFELSDKEQISYNQFRKDVEVLFGEDQGYYSFEFYPNGIGSAITVKFHHRKLKQPLKRDITDLESW